MEAGARVAVGLYLLGAGSYGLGRRVKYYLDLVGSS